MNPSPEQSLLQVDFARGPRKAPKRIREQGQFGNIFDEGRRWRADWRFDGRRRRKAYAKEKFGLAHVETELRAELSKIACGKTLISGVSQADADDLAWIKERGLRHYQITGRRETIRAVLEDGFRRREEAFARESGQRLPVIIEEFLALVRAQSVAQKSGLGHYLKLRQRLHQFARAFPGSPAALTQAEFRTWLNGLGVSAKTRNHYRAPVIQMLHYAREQRYVERALVDDLAAVRPLKTLPVKARPYSAEETRAWLEHLELHAPGMVLPVVLVAFCGFRWSEVISPRGAADFADIDLERGEAKVWAGHSKVGEDRIAALPSNALAFFRKYGKASGRICPVNLPDRRLRKLASEAQITIKPNGFRKGFISHRCAVVGDIVQVADEAGTSPAKIKSNYLNRPSKSGGLSYFSIEPRQEQFRLEFLSPNCPHPRRASKNPK